MRIERLSTNPIIRPHMDAMMGDNINGPSLIRVPDWIDNPLGRYYLYFANHKGRYIRLVRRLTALILLALRRSNQ